MSDGDPSNWPSLIEFVLGNDAISLTDRSFFRWVLKPNPDQRPAASACLDHDFMHKGTKYIPLPLQGQMRDTASTISAQSQLTIAHTESMPSMPPDAIQGWVNNTATAEMDNSLPSPCPGNIPERTSGNTDDYNNWAPVDARTAFWRTRVNPQSMMIDSKVSTKRKKPRVIGFKFFSWRNTWIAYRRETHTVNVTQVLKLMNIAFSKLKLVSWREMLGHREVIMQHEHSVFGTYVPFDDAVLVCNIYYAGETFLQAFCTLDN